jgi:hypothetical protein
MPKTARMVTTERMSTTTGTPAIDYKNELHQQCNVITTVKKQGSPFFSIAKAISQHLLNRIR